MRTVAAVVALVVCVHAGLWMLLQRQQAVVSIDAPLASISYSPYARSQHPDYGDRPTPAAPPRPPHKLRAALTVPTPTPHPPPTYARPGGGGRVPALAAGLGRRVTRDIWTKKNGPRNGGKTQAAIAPPRRYSNINAI